VPDIAREQFLSIVAHQLRYPLVPLRNAAALLKLDSSDAPTIRRAAEIIERQASGMQRLIDDLVDLSHMQRGSLELRRQRTPLGELMERALESEGPFASERGLTLSVSLPALPVYLLMDVLRLSQALHQIIANATKYTDVHGHVDVRAQCEGAEVVITVSDTGIGIPAAELESIFGLFVQSVQGGRTEPGLGLGLYLARHLIEAHEGTVTAASAGPGHGSMFTIRLPCEVPTAAQAASTGDPSPA
jgi:signal transduction histidine kinase